MSASPAPSPFKGLARYDEADASDGVRSIAFSPNGCLVATAGSGDRTARVWAPPLPGCG